jgi:hypothetical protein
MAVRDRIDRYRKVGGAADLVRVEVLVPERCRMSILEEAARMREEHRARKAKMIDFLLKADDLYGMRLSDNIDLVKVDGLEEKSRIVADALMRRGDAKAFVMGRKLLSDLEVAS